jgi:hypothetical protein
MPCLTPPFKGFETLAFTRLQSVSSNLEGLDDRTESPLATLLESTSHLTGYQQTLVL